MTEDIWAENPVEELIKFINEKYPGYVHPPTIIDEFNAWLEKLRASFDESIADCHHSLELVAKKLGAYREKAENWNELCEGLEYGVNTPVRDILQEINLIDRDNKLRRKKVEAVETYIVKLRDQAKKTGDIFERGFCTGIVDNLEEILGVEE